MWRAVTAVTFALLHTHCLPLATGSLQIVEYFIQATTTTEYWFKRQHVHGFKLLRVRRCCHLQSTVIFMSSFTVITVFMWLWLQQCTEYNGRVVVRSQCSVWVTYYTTSQCCTAGFGKQRATSASGCDTLFKYSFLTLACINYCTEH